MEQNSGQAWREVRLAHPHQWVVFEALTSRSVQDKRVVDAISVIETSADSEVAMRQYLKLHRQDHNRELYVVHTDREELDITERKWLGIRMA